MDAVTLLERRISSLRLTPEQLGISLPLSLFKMRSQFGEFDQRLYELVDISITKAEKEIGERGFVEPRDESGLSLGDVHICTTELKTPIRISFEEDRPNKVTHCAVLGMTESGKSRLQAQIASQAARKCSTLLLDIHPETGFRIMDCMRQTHTFLDWKDIRFNPFDSIEGVLDGVIDHSVLYELARTYGLEFSEHEGDLALAKIRKERTPTFPLLLSKLQSSYVFGYSKRNQYRDSIILIISKVLNATGDLFNSTQSIDIEKLSDENVVIELGGLEPQEQAFLTKLFFERIRLLTLSGKQRHKPLLFFLDEAQRLARERHFSEKILQLRHAHIHLIANFQNTSQVPIEVLGNSDALICFQSVAEQDTKAMAQAARLTPEQQIRLGVLDKGQCICFFPRMGWKTAFVGRVPYVSASEPDLPDLKRKAREMLKSITTNVAPPEENDEEDFEEAPFEEAPPAEKPSTIEKHEERLINDVLIQTHEFSPMKSRYERAGIRSASTGEAVQKRLLDKGLIRVDTLAVGRGRPILLCEPTEKLLSERNVAWKKTNGKLATRAASWMVENKLKQLDGWAAQREGILRANGLTGEEQKKIDFLCRHDSGQVVSIEIAGNADHEAHNALFCLSCQEVSKHIVIALSREILREVKRRFNGHSELKGNRSITLTLLSEVLKDGWTP